MMYPRVGPRARKRDSMRHFVYAMKSTDKAPAGGGLTHNWFMHYKWDVDDETYVPYVQPEGAALPTEGDTIWFVEDQFLLGCARITRVTEDPLNDRHEIYYDTRDLQDFQGQKTVSTAQPSGVVHAPSSVNFFDELKRHMDVLHLPRSVRAAAAAATVTLEEPTK